MSRAAITVGLLAFFSCLHQPLYAQSFFEEVRDRVIEGILPGGYSAGVELRTLLRSKTWKKYREDVSDREAMNTIYALAYIRTSGNTRLALFATGLGVLDHRTIPIKLPFGGELDLPLTLETEKHYSERVAQLPAHLYSDSVSDRDKLQHFFFSAYLKNVLGMNWLVKMLGNLVEIGEDAFVVGGMNDERDKHANADGLRFGTIARSDPNARPSDHLTSNP